MSRQLALFVRNCLAGNDEQMTRRSCTARAPRAVLIVTTMIRRAVALAGLVIALVCLAPPRPAGAHALLVKSQPANGSTVAVPPDVVRLWFNEEISSGVSTARLVDRGGAAPC